YNARRRADKERGPYICRAGRTARQGQSAIDSFLSGCQNACNHSSEYVRGCPDCAISCDPGRYGWPERSNRFLIQGGLLSLLATGLVSNRLEPVDALM